MEDDLPAAGKLTVEAVRQAIKNMEPLTVVFDRQLSYPEASDPIVRAAPPWRGFVPKPEGEPLTAAEIAARKAKKAQRKARRTMRGKP